MKKKKPEPKLTQDAYVLKHPEDCFIFSSLSSDRDFTESHRTEWRNAKVVKVKIAEQ